jgi:hypothetical protein
VELGPERTRCEARLEFVVPVDVSIELRVPLESRTLRLERGRGLNRATTSVRVTSGRGT